jgi:hypothetical protein
LNKCAYCNETRRLTREHIIPGFFYETELSKHSKWFLERHHEKFHRSEIVIKDVCSDCNNGILSVLDNFGKNLLESKLAEPVFADDQQDFVCDFIMLLRWLLKICYNSGRIHNTDIDILKQYVPFILGKEDVPKSIHLGIFTIAPIVLSGVRGWISAERRHSDDPTLQIPKCFRISQFRMQIPRNYTCIQRAVIINSYAFIILGVPPDDPQGASHLNYLEKEFISFHSGGKIVDFSLKKVSLAPSTQNAFTINIGHIENNPVTYGIIKSDWIKAQVKDRKGIICYGFCREEIETLEIESFFKSMDLLLGSREVSMAVRQRIEFFVEGYDNDSRELWEIPQVRQFFHRLHDGFQNWLFLAFPDGEFLNVLIKCLCFGNGENESTANIDPECLRHFLVACFNALNQLCHRFAISEAINREITDAFFRIVNRSYVIRIPF